MENFEAVKYTAGGVVFLSELGEPLERLREGELDGG